MRGKYNMSAFPDWEQYAVIQQKPSTGCIPTGFEMLLRAAHIEGIDFDVFQDEFDLENQGITKNDFKKISQAVHSKYPQINFEIREFTSGIEKLGFVEKMLDKKQPVLISLTLKPQGGWHIMPVVDADEFFLFLFFGFQNGHKIVQKIEKTKFIQIHDEWPGGKDIAFLKI